MYTYIKIYKEAVMKILIAGSRTIKSYDIKQHINKNTSLIICGGAVGVDTLAEQTADELGISKLVLRPEYGKYGKAAPLVRNKKMVELADEVIVIWDGKSRGALYTFEYAQEQNKRVLLLDLSKESKENEF